MHTTKEAAKLIGVSQSWVTKCLRLGKVKSNKLGPIFFVDDDAIEQLKKIAEDPYLYSAKNKVYLK